ncbi:restriction endonuclease [Nonomuraea roseola]|uniref:Restriction endonuclease n=1 Tax=Nonomuraea roseola TaxID=46179 RepID=A0ABV5PVX0_9ACTN
MARRKGRRRQRKGREIDLVLWGGGAVAAVVGARALFGFVGEHWPLFAAAGLVAAVAAVAFPLIRARRVAQRQRQWFADHLELARVDELSGSDFETLTAELLRRDGFRHVRELGRAGDMGVDVTAVGPDGRRFAFQCKRYAGTVGSPEVRNFLGALAHTFAGHTGVLVTSGRLTRHAMAEASAAKLILVERDRLAGWLRGDVPLELRH